MSRTFFKALLLWAQNPPHDLFHPTSQFFFYNRLQPTPRPGRCLCNWPQTNNTFIQTLTIIIKYLIISLEFIVRFYNKLHIQLRPLLFFYWIKNTTTLRTSFFEAFSKHVAFGIIYKTEHIYWENTINIDWDRVYRYSFCKHLPKINEYLYPGPA